MYSVISYVCSPRNHQYEASEGGLEEWYIPGSGPGIWVVQPVLATGGGGGGSHPPPNTTGSNSTGPWIRRVPTPRRLLVWRVSERGRAKYTANLSLPQHLGGKHVRDLKQTAAKQCLQPYDSSPSPSPQIMEFEKIETLFPSLSTLYNFFTHVHTVYCSAKIFQMKQVGFYVQ